VLGLGDSNYQAMGYRNVTCFTAADCNRGARLVDKALERAGGARFATRGEADERTDSSEVVPWVATMWRALLAVEGIEAPRALAVHGLDAAKPPPPPEPLAALTDDEMAAVAEKLGALAAAEAAEDAAAAGAGATADAGATVDAAPADDAAPLDVRGDGGVLKTTRAAGDGAAPAPGDVVVAHYTGTLDSGEVFDCSRAKGRPFRFALGRGDVVGGWDAGFATMRVGERATLACRHDYAYGAEGLPGRIPPYATLNFDVELVAVEPAAVKEPAAAGAAADGGGGYERWLALPAPPAADADGAAPDADGGGGDGVSVLHVGGAAVRIDALGPMVVNKDGTFARITNWATMTEAEQARTARVIAKRNAQRLGRST
jgi:FKBP-type peptidyl-prolyl cis-trans isomerase